MNGPAPSGERRSLAAPLLAVALVVAGALGTGAVTTAGAATADTQAGGTLAFEYTFERLPDRPGSVRVHVTTRVPEGVNTVGVQPPESASDPTTAGYERASHDGETEYRWSRESGPPAPSVSYVVPVNRTEDGRIEATSTGEWALFDWRSTDLSWRYERSADTPEPAVVERSVGAVGEGVVGPAYAYLGPYTTETRTVDGERIRLVVPAAAREGMAAPPSEVADTLAAASADLRVGARNDRLNVFVAPSAIEVAGRLSRTTVAGEGDAMVAADEPVDTPDSAWLHEYVHSRQAYESGTGAGWLDDGLAEYYAARLTHEQGRISDERFHEYVGTDEDTDAVLADTESVTDDASYTKGMRVSAALDAEIRAASDGSTTLQSVFRRANAHDGPVTEAALAAFASEAAGESLTEWVDRYVGTSAAPEVPPSLAASGDGSSATADGSSATAGGPGETAGGGSSGAGPLPTAPTLFLAAVVAGLGAVASRVFEP